MPSNASSTAHWLRWAVALGLSTAAVLGYASDDASGLGASLDSAVPAVENDGRAVDQQRLTLLARMLEQGEIADARSQTPSPVSATELLIDVDLGEAGTSAHEVAAFPRQAMRPDAASDEPLASAATQLAQMIPAHRPVDPSNMSAGGIVEVAALPERLSTPEAPHDIKQLEAIEPTAGITFRRDTVEPPLLESERWTEWVLSVAINDREVSDGSVFIRDPVSDRLAVELATAQSWRLLIDRDAVLSFEGVPFYPLDAIAGLQQEVDETALSIQLQIPLMLLSYRGSRSRTG